MIENSSASLAERQGFEPWEGGTPQRFSRPPLSTAQPPLRAQKLQRPFTNFLKDTSLLEKTKNSEFFYSNYHPLAEHIMR